MLARQPGPRLHPLRRLPSRCPTGSIEYRYFRADPERMRRVFFVIVAALHAVWLGVARL